MWIVLALCSALGLGVYDIMKKLSVRDNDVLTVLMLNTVFGALLLSPVIMTAMAAGDFGFGNTFTGHILIMVKALIVLGSWILGYFAIKHLPLTIQGPINATRPVMVLVGALLIFGERLNPLQWAGVLLGFTSLFLISRIGAKEGFSYRNSRWLWMSVGAMLLGACSALFDKFLLGLYRPLEVQAWYSLYQACIMTVAIIAIKRASASSAGKERFHWRWSILGITVFLTAADLAYFYALSLPGALVSVVSMIRRGSVIVSFLYGVTALHEKHVRAKLVDLGILLVSLALLVLGSN